MTQSIPTIVLGATGYVGGELLRLIAEHPVLNLSAAVSRETGAPLAQQFSHLAPHYPQQCFTSIDSALAELDDHERVALFSAAPHASSAALLKRFIDKAKSTNTRLHCVDASADFRFSSAGAFEAVYGEAHGAPDLIDQFCSSVPEHWRGPLRPHAGNPGCFASAMLLSSLPLLQAGLIDGDLFAAGITGSTGSGKSPVATTHHPFRHANVYSYKALDHRHVPEVCGLLEDASGIRPNLNFVPHSGPFARGIHMTVQATKAPGVSPADVEAAFHAAYDDSIFVNVQTEAPRLKDVVGSNYARLSVSVNDNSIAVCCVIDNLIKGAAGSAMQWMNKLNELPEAAGLGQTALGYT